VPCTYKALSASLLHVLPLRSHRRTDGAPLHYPRVNTLRYYRLLAALRFAGRFSVERQRPLAGGDARTPSEESLEPKPGAPASLPAPIRPKPAQPLSHYFKIFITECCASFGFLLKTRHSSVFRWASGTGISSAPLVALAHFTSLRSSYPFATLTFK